MELNRKYIDQSKMKYVFTWFEIKFFLNSTVSNEQFLYLDKFEMYDHTLKIQTVFYFKF